MIVPGGVADSCGRPEKAPTRAKVSRTVEKPWIISASGAFLTAQYFLSCVPPGAPPPESSVDLEACNAAHERDGYDEIVERSQPAHLSNAAHSHPFAVHALMLAGELRLTCNGRTQVCRAGATFTMAAGCMHEEVYGAAGARYLTGRCAPAAAA
jgi:hypothetical protein